MGLLDMGRLITTLGEGFASLVRLVPKPSVVNQPQTAYTQSERKACIYGSFRKLGVPDLGVLIIRILLFRALY